MSIGILGKRPRVNSGNHPIETPSFDGAASSWVNILSNETDSQIISAINHHQEINLEGAELDTNQAKKLATALRHANCCPSSLNLRNATSTEMTLIFEALEGKSTLVALDVDGFRKITPERTLHGIQTRHLVSISKLLMHKSLGVLNLSHQNSLYWGSETKPLTAFLQCIWNADSMKVLHLDHCNMTQKQLFEICRMLFHVGKHNLDHDTSSRLTELTVLGNPFRIDTATRFFYEMERSLNYAPLARHFLEKLHLSIDSSLATTDQIIKYIETAKKMMGSIPSLKSLRIFGATPPPELVSAARESERLRKLLVGFRFDDLDTMRLCLQEIGYLSVGVWREITPFTFEAMLNPALRC